MNDEGFGTVCGIAVWLIFVILGLLILGWVISWGGTFNFRIPFVEINLGRLP